MCVPAGLWNPGSHFVTGSFITPEASKLKSLNPLIPAHTLATQRQKSLSDWNLYSEEIFPFNIYFVPSGFVCVRLCNLALGTLQARTLEQVAMPSSRGSSWPRGRTCISCISCAGRWVLYLYYHLGSPIYFGGRLFCLLPLEWGLGVRPLRVGWSQGGATRWATGWVRI